MTDERNITEQLSAYLDGELSDAELHRYKRKLIVLTGIFSLGVMAVMVGAGALVGWFGSEIRNVPIWSGHAIWAQRIAGVAFIAIGIWMANITRAPIVCKIPFPRLRRNPEDLSMPMLFGAGFVWAVVVLHRERTRQAALRSFHASNAYLGAVLLAIVIDALAV